MCKLGRNFGIGVSLISQRPQEVNKKALNLTECFFAFQMTGPHERKTVQDWMREKGVDDTIASDLPKLAVGQPHIWSPQWLRISETIKIAERWTYDASSTPRFGAKPVSTRPLSPADLEKLTVDLKQAVIKAKENDPEALRRRIRELERRPIEKKPEVDAGAIARAEERGRKLAFDQLSAQIKEVDAMARKQQTIMARAISILSEQPLVPKIEMPKGMGGTRAGVSFAEPLRRVPLPPPRHIATPSNIPNSEINLKSGARRMLAAAVKYNPNGINAIQMKTLAGIKHVNTFSTYKTQLLSAGFLIEKHGLYFPTPEGIDYLGGDIATPETTREVMDTWLPFFKDGVRRMLKHLVYDLKGEFTTHEELMQAAAIEHPNTYSTYKTQLKSAHLVVEQGGEIAANKETLFL
jgi:hypothetical protein